MSHLFVALSGFASLGLATAVHPAYARDAIFMAAGAALALVIHFVSNHDSKP